MLKARGMESCHCCCLVIACCGSLIAPCPGHIVVRCYCCHAPSSPCHPALLLHLTVGSSLFCVLVMWLHCIPGSPWLNVTCVCSLLSCLLFVSQAIISFGGFCHLWATIFVCGQLSSYVGSHLRFLASHGDGVFVGCCWHWVLSHGCCWQHCWVVVSV